MAVFTVTTAEDVSSEGDGVPSPREAAGRADVAAGVDGPSYQFDYGTAGGGVAIEAGGESTITENEIEYGSSSGKYLRGGIILNRISILNDNIVIGNYENPIDDRLPGGIAGLDLSNGQNVPYTDVQGAVADPAAVQGVDLAAVFAALDDPAPSGADPGGIGAGNVRPSADDDVITGTTAADTIDALTGDDRVRAGAGDDWVDGAFGSDLVRGGAGDDDDDVRGGPGRDFLFGGAGRDVFDFDLAGDSPPGEGFRDAVGDFAPGTDRLDFASIPTGGAGQVAFRFVDTAGFTAAGQVREAVVDGRTVVQGNTDADRAPEFEVELAGVIDLAAGDFVL